MLLSAARIKDLWFKYGLGLGLASQCVLLSTWRGSSLSLQAGIGNEQGQCIVALVWIPSSVVLHLEAVHTACA